MQNVSLYQFAPAADDFVICFNELRDNLMFNTNELETKIIFVPSPDDINSNERSNEYYLGLDEVDSELKNISRKISEKWHSLETREERDKLPSLSKVTRPYQGYTPEFLFTVSMSICSGVLSSFFYDLLKGWLKKTEGRKAIVKTLHGKHIDISNMDSREFNKLIKFLYENYEVKGAPMVDCDFESLGFQTYDPGQIQIMENKLLQVYSKKRDLGNIPIPKD